MVAGEGEGVQPARGGGGRKKTLAQVCYGNAATARARRVKVFGVILQLRGARRAEPVLAIPAILTRVCCITHLDAGVLWECSSKEPLGLCAASGGCYRRILVWKLL